MKNNLELVRKLTELLEWQKEQEEQVKLAEQLSQKLKDQLKNERETIIETDDENLIDKSSLNNHLINVLENNLSNCEKSFDKNLLSDIIEESFEQGLSNEYQSKFSTPKENLSIDSYNDEMNYTSDYREKSFTKHCTEECLKSNCIHSLKFNESLDSILNIISQYNLSKKQSKDNFLNDDFSNENDKKLNKSDRKKNEFYNSDNENEFDKTYLHFKEVYKEVISKSLEKPELNFKSSSETNLSFEFPNKINKSQSKESINKNDYKSFNRTFSSETINLQLKEIEKDLEISDIENYPIKPGIDGCNVRTFDELLNQQLTNTSLDYINKSENPTKKPFLKKGAGLKRFQLSSTNQPKGKLCKLKKNNETKKTEAESVKRQVNKKRIDYLARPKRAISEKDVNTIEKIQSRTKRIIDNDSSDLKNLLTKTENKNIKKENIPMNVENKKENYNFLINKEKRKENFPIKKENNYLPSNKEKKKEKLNQVQLVSKLSKDLSSQENFINKNEYIQRDWDKKESEESSNKRVEALLEKIIEVCEAKTDSKKEEEIKIDLINFLKSLLKVENNFNYQSSQCKGCGKNFDLCNDNSSENISTNISLKKNNYSEKLLTKPNLNIQTIELREKIENLHKRLNNLQTRCDLDEKKIMKKIDKSFTLQKQDCTCSNQINILKNKINFLNSKLNEIEENTLINSIDEKKNSNKNLEDDVISILSSVDSKVDYVYSKNQPVINLEKNNKITKYKNGLTLIEKENGTVEKVCSNGYKETFLNDGTIIRLLIDGTKIIDYSNGEREISTSIFKRRELVNGEVKTIYSDGTKETRYPDGRLKIKDKYGNIIADSKILAKNS